MNCVDHFRGFSHLELGLANFSLVWQSPWEMLGSGTRRRIHYIVFLDCMYLRCHSLHTGLHDDSYMKIQSALTNEDSRMSHWIAPLGDLALATGCSSVCQSSFVPINSNTLTLPQIEPTSNTETAVTQTEMGKNISSSNSHCKTPQSYKSTTNPPSLAHYNAMADMIAYPFIPLPVCSPLDFPYQDFSSISTFSYDSLADPDPSNYSYVPNSTGDTSYPLSVDTTPSNQTDTGPLLIEDQTGDEESMSSSGNGWLCAPISLEYSDNCCMNQLKTYPSGGERKPDPYRSTVRESYLISPNDTLCNDQAGAHKCNYSSPVTGEPCGAILSRVYDCNRHEDSILLDSEKEFKYHLGGEAGLSTRCQGTVT